LVEKGGEVGSVDERKRMCYKEEFDDSWISRSKSMWIVVFIGKWSELWIV